MKPAQKIAGFIISLVTLLVWSIPGAFGFDYEPHNGEWCTTCHDMVNCSTPNIYCVPSTITTTNSGDKTVVFTSSDSQVRGEAPYDGICEVCHTGTNYHRNSLSGDHTHFADQKCTSCHLHGPMVMISRNLCYTCHGGNSGDAPEGNPPMFTSPSGQSHNTHTKINSRGPNPALDCNNCHDTSDYSTFADGNPISSTTVCDTCHSPGGTYDGVNNAVIGAKNNWTAGAYSGNNLASGKEKWCAGCHDENPSVIQGVSAPNIAGEEGANTNYGIGYGYYKTGHGLEAGIYPASGAPGANMQCSECHDLTSSHIDGEQRTYLAASGNYQEGYRLKDVAGGLPMEVPRIDIFTIESDFALCFQCHDSDMYLNTENLTTNFVEGVNNRHRDHLNSGGGNANRWDSDWDGTTTDSTMSCIACHNVHGSPSPRMIRHGELISDPGTTNKVPSIDFQYLTEYTYPALMDSSGGMIRSIGVGPGNVAKNGICVMCHADYVSYNRTPEDLYPPEIIFAYGQIGSNILNVTFSEGVYSDTGMSGDLTEGDFTLTDIDDARSISSVSHNAGDDFATLTLSSALDPSLDIGTDLLAAFSSASIYDASDNAMGTGTVTISDDSYVPSISISIPQNGASGIALNSELSFTLADSESGVDWSTFSLQLSGNSGYAKSYSELDTSIVSKSGPLSSYRVKVKPDTFFGSGETITVTVSVDDFAGNSLVSPVWSFTAAGGPIWETPDLVHEPEQFGSPNNLIDGNLATGNTLGSGIGTFDHFVTYQLDSGGDFYSVSGVRSYGGAPGTAGEWEVYVSKDGYTFTQVVDGWSVGSESQWFENNFGASDNVRYLRFNHRHGGPEGSNTAFEFQFKGTPVDNPVEMSNSIPNLSWTGEAGYINDGVNPDSGTDPTDFEFRINYTDADNDAPGIIQVWVDSDDNGSYTYFEKFSMTETDPGDTDFTDGKLYTVTITLNNAGDGSMNYRFLATDSIDIAGGDPADNNIVIVSP